MNLNKYKTLFKMMLLEETRLHTQLFDKKRLLTYPLVIAALLAIAAYSSTQILNLVSVNIFIIITHILLFFFGMQTGSLAFESRDMIKNLLGETTFLLYANTILPISEKKLVGTFILKDILFYAGVFFLPVSVALGGATMNLKLIPILFLTTTLIFCLGLTLTISSISLQFKSRYSIIGIITTLIVIVLTVIQFNTIDIFDYYSLANFTTLSILTLGTVLFSILSVISFETPSELTEKETYKDSAFITKLTEKIPLLNSNETALYRKTNTDIFRSSGGIWKIVFSSGTLLLLAVVLEQLLTNEIRIQPYHTLLYTTIFLMGSFTTYTWVFQGDSKEEYTIYPISNSDIINGKFASFMTFTAGSLGLIIAGTTIYYNTSIYEVLTTILFGTAFSIFYYGVTTYHAGTKPTEFLFDSVRFTKFSISIMTVTLPVLIYSLVGSLLITEIVALISTIILSVPLLAIGFKAKNIRIKNL